MFDTVIQRFGTVDIVVANSGLQKDARFVDMTLADWNTVMNVNLTGQFLSAQRAVREFLRRGPRPVSKALGKIICMSSVHEVIPWGGHVNYATSKGGIQMMMKSLAQEVAPHRIRVNSIAPGAIRTPINKEAWDSPKRCKSCWNSCLTGASAKARTSGGRRCGWRRMKAITWSAPPFLSMAA